MNDIYEDFDFDPVPLGQGAFGIVYKGTDKVTNEVRAIKQINIEDIKGGKKAKLADLKLADIDEDAQSTYRSFINEVTSLKTLDHPNIIKLYEVYE